MPRVITIGNFDGVHLGHRAIINRARAVAERFDNATVTAVTFEPHPALLLRPEIPKPRLATIDQKIELLKKAGADDVKIYKPTPDLLAMSPAAWIERMITDLSPAAFVEGPDFRFGRKRKGDIQTLQQLGQQFGFRVEIVDPIPARIDSHHGVPVSSSIIRTLIGMGRAVDAARLLARPYTLTAKIVKGDQRGRQIGVPTANLDPQALTDRVLPAPGVYAGFFEIEPETLQAEPRKGWGAISVGMKPTFAGNVFTIEAHLLDFQGDLYGKNLTLGFSRWLRDQVRFDGLDQLREQLQRDIAATRRFADMELLSPSGDTFEPTFPLDSSTAK